MSIIKFRILTSGEPVGRSNSHFGKGYAGNQKKVKADGKETAQPENHKKMVGNMSSILK